METEQDEPARQVFTSSGSWTEPNPPGEKITVVLTGPGGSGKTLKREG